MPSQIITDKQSIIKRLADGELLSNIARTYGVTGQAISNRLSDDPEYQEARISSLASRMDKRESELEDAPDSVSVARARELLSHARWRAEREAPQVWGQKIEQTGTRIEVVVNNPGAPLTIPSVEHAIIEHVSAPDA
jgi:hypothetical protein